MTRMIQAAWLALAALTLPACTAAEDKAPDYRYRLTVEVETPEGLKTGSSVIEVKQRFVRPGMSPSAWAIERRIRGEAVAVDLPNGQTLYALLRSADEVDWAKSIVQRVSPRVSGEEGKEAFDNIFLIEDAVEVPRKWSGPGPANGRSAYPMLVTFADEIDPTSVAEADPDDLAATFGEGIRLKRITVQLTEDPVTTGIVERLPSPTYRGFFNWDGETNPNEGFVISISDFVVNSN